MAMNQRTIKAYFVHPDGLALKAFFTPELTGADNETLFPLPKSVLLLSGQEVTFTLSVKSSGSLTWNYSVPFYNSQIKKVEYATGSFNLADGAEIHLDQLIVAGDPVTDSVMDYVNTQIAQSGAGIPAGGTTGQVLAKQSNTDYDTEWVDQTGVGGAVASVNGQTGNVTLTTSNISEGSNLYHTAGRVLATALTGLSLAVSSVIADTDTHLQAFGKLQAQISNRLVAASNLSDLTNAATARSNLGIGNIDNTSDLNKPISTATQTALNAKADLVGGLVPSAQLPSFVDDVLEYADFASLPGTGATGKIYVTLNNNLTYRWSGSAYVEISASLVLGSTSSTAFRGDLGQTAYDHTFLTNNPHSVTKAQVGLGSVENTALSTWAGSTNLTTLGTVSAGTWQGGVVAGQYGGTGVNNLGKTITLGGNLTTFGAFALTLTVSAATNVTLPTTGTLATIADVNAVLPSQTGNSGKYLTTNGSAVSWATVGTFADNVFAIQDNADATKQIAFEASGISTGTTRTLTAPNFSGTLATIDNAQTFSAKQTFTPGATVAGLNVGSVSADPSTPLNGDLWYEFTSNALKARINGATVSLGAGGGGSPGGSTGDIQYNNAGAFAASLLRQTTNTIEQSNSTNAQSFRIYNTVDSISSPTNYERGGLKWVSNVLTLFAEKGGTGTSRNIKIDCGAGQLDVNTTGGSSLVVNGNGVNNILIAGWGGLQGVGMNENNSSGFSLRIRGVSPTYAMSFVSGNTNSDSFYFGAQAGTSSTLPFVRMVSILAARPTLGIVKLTSQTGNLQQFTDTDGTTIFSRFNKDGYFMTLKNAAPADADLATSELAIWFDSTAGAAKLMVKAKNASGTVVTGNIALA